MKCIIKDDSRGLYVTKKIYNGFDPAPFSLSEADAVIFSDEKEANDWISDYVISPNRYKYEVIPAN